MEVNYDDMYFTEEELRNTPKRVKNFFKELKHREEFEFTVFDNPSYEGMIAMKDIDFMSFCSHHLLPFVGKCHIAYIPDKLIVGASKLARTVDKFASKPQLQERLTQEIIDYIEEKLKPKGIIVIIEAKHMCISQRGVKKTNSQFVTSATKGCFNNKDVKDEFFKGILGRT